MLTEILIHRYGKIKDQQFLLQNLNIKPFYPILMFTLAHYLSGFKEKTDTFSTQEGFDISGKVSLYGQDIHYDLRSNSRQSSLKKCAIQADEAIRKQETVFLPIIAAYDLKQNVIQKPIKPFANSRFHAYQKCLHAQLNLSAFSDWFMKNDLVSRLEKRPLFQQVKQAVLQYSHAEDIFYDIKEEAVVMIFNGRIVNLNDLEASVLSQYLLVADIAIKTITLNPHSSLPLQETEGTIIIQNTDINIHSLFPRIQFLEN